MRLIANAPSHIGYLLKDRVSDVDTLLDAVDRAARGKCVVDPAIVSRLMRRDERPGPFGGLGHNCRDGDSSECQCDWARLVWLNRQT
jgi:DNA-binding NarL/FixJ family response regulator